MSADIYRCTECGAIERGDVPRCPQGLLREVAGLRMTRRGKPLECSITVEAEPSSPPREKEKS